MVDNLKLLKIIEEASEVSQCCSKYIRFGKDNYNPNDEKKTENYKTLIQEIIDLEVAISKFLELDRDVFNYYNYLKSNIEYLRSRSDKYDYFMNISKKINNKE